MWYNSATRSTGSVFARVSAPQNVLYDLKGPLSLSRVMMWSDSFGKAIVSTGVNPAGDTGDMSPVKIGLRGTVLHYVPRKFSS